VPPTTINYHHSLESPPVSVVVSLNGTGAPTKVYDMIASPLGSRRLSREKVKG